MPTSLTPASYAPQNHEKMSVRKLSKQPAISLSVGHAVLSLLFPFFGSGASLEFIKLRPHCCSLSFAIFSLETWQLLKEHHQMIACDQEFDSDMSFSLDLGTRPRETSTSGCKDVFIYCNCNPRVSSLCVCTYIYIYIVHKYIYICSFVYRSRQDLDLAPFPFSL